MPRIRIGCSIHVLDIPTLKLVPMIIVVLVEEYIKQVSRNHVILPVSNTLIHQRYQAISRSTYKYCHTRVSSNEDLIESHKERPVAPPHSALNRILNTKISKIKQFLYSHINCSIATPSFLNHTKRLHLQSPLIPSQVPF